MTKIDKSELELLSESYTPIINDLIEKNKNYYLFKEKIRWAFNFGNESEVMTAVTKDNIIKINIFSVMRCYFAKDLYTIEYYLLHEIRHIYQHLVIDDFNQKLEIPVDSELVKQWIYEENNYIPAIDKNGKENEGYFKQDIEYDAYAYSYALMKFKYGDNNISHLYVPEQYNSDFYNIVNGWIKCFESIDKES